MNLTLETISNVPVYGTIKYYENTCLAKCVAQLKEQTDGMSEKDKAWTIAQWVDEHVWYDGDYAGGMETKYSLIWKQEGAGVCEQQAIANQLFGCLMGLKRKDDVQN